MKMIKKQCCVMVMLLLLCTICVSAADKKEENIKDQIADYVGIDEIESLLTGNESISISTCENIIQAALTAGSKDDISVVIVEI